MIANNRSGSDHLWTADFGGLIQQRSDRTRPHTVPHTSFCLISLIVCEKMDTKHLKPWKLCYHLLLLLLHIQHFKSQGHPPVGHVHVPMTQSYYPHSLFLVVLMFPCGEWWGQMPRINALYILQSHNNPFLISWLNFAMPNHLLESGGTE